MAEPVIGILGGMGPEATVDLYREIIRLTPARRDQDHIPVLIYSNPKIPDRTRAILEGGENPLPYLIESARLLQRMGAGILAIPCNTAHYFLPQLAAAVQIPVLNMIEETYLALRAGHPDLRAVGLLGATGTVRSGIYHAVFERRGVSILVPDDAEQARVHAAIAEIKSGGHSHSTRQTLEAIGANLLCKGAEAVILGCTEIPLVVDQESAGFACLNPTRILAQAAVDWAMGKR